MMVKNDLSKEYYFSVPKHELKGDQIQIFARPHVVSFLPQLFLIFMLLVTPIIVLLVLMYGVGLPKELILDNPLALNIFILSASAFYLGLAFFSFAEWINYYYDVLIVTKNHLIDIKQITLFNREISQLHLAQVEDVSSQIKGFFPTLFAFGNVIVQTAGASENALIKNIPNPQKVSTKIFQLHSQIIDSGSRATKGYTEREVGQLFTQGEK